MSQLEGSVSAEATLSNWDGHMTVENSRSALCCSPFLRRSRLNSEHYNGYDATAKHRRNGLINADTDEGGKDRDSDINYDENAYVSSPDIRTRERRESARGLKRERPAGFYSSPNRSSIGCLASGGISRHPSSRLAASSRQTTMGSSILGESMTEIVIEDLQSEHEPTSAILNYCKRKFLKPYVGILSLVGLSPISTETTLCLSCLSYLLNTVILMLLLFGYFLQYCTSYRGDRGFSNYSKSYPSVPFSEMFAAGSRESTARTIGELLFGYVIPNMLNLLGFITAVFVCRVVDNEQLQNLIERVFLMSMKPRRLCIILWVYVSLGFGFLIMLLAYAMPSVLMQTQIVQVKWLTEILNSWQITTKITLLATIFIQDLVEIIILTSYCIECYLLRVHLATLSHKLLMHSIDSLDWMREVLEFRKLLDHLNQRVALPVCFFIVMNLAYAFAGIVYLFNDFDFHYSAMKVVILNIINVLLWLVMGLMPFFMAASVTRVCQTAQASGHQIRVRPFVYHNTSSEDLNSTLLFATSLDMSAKLFRMPIQPNYLCFAILIVSVVILTLGMCLNISVLGTI